MKVGSNSSVDLTPSFSATKILSLAVSDEARMLEVSPVILNLSTPSSGHASFHRYFISFQ